MKNICLSFLSWALVAVTVLSSIHVEAFGWNTLSIFQVPVIASRMPQERCRNSHSLSSVMRVNSISSILSTAVIEKPSVTDTCTDPNTLKIARRSILASSLALTLATCSFVEMANAESPIVQTTAVVANSDTVSTDPVESSGSPAGNAVVYAWVGISAFAGVKGISDRIQQEQQEEQ